MLSANLKLFMMFGEASTENVFTFLGLNLSYSDLTIDPSEFSFFILGGWSLTSTVSRAYLKFERILKIF